MEDTISFMWLIKKLKKLKIFIDQVFEKCYIIYAFDEVRQFFKKN